MLRTTLSILMFATIAIAGDTPGYQKGTLTKDSSSAHKSYDLKDGDKGYQISNCGDFQDGQVVDYRVKEDENKLYIRREGGKEYKCTIEATLTGSPDASPVPNPYTYKKGTIEGYEIRYLTSADGFGQIRKVKAFELRGPDSTYEIAFCGSFEAGQFTAGQVVEYRGGGERINIRHDNDKEWSCQVVGKVKTQNASSEEAARPAATSSAPATPAPVSTAKLSITSVPDGADIEIDGNFSGNTPSDLEVPEGEHTIAVKKSGYKDWQRKMKVSAGSSVHLNAEMEKAPNL